MKNNFHQQDFELSRRYQI